jgi:hypothetical protein
MFALPTPSCGFEAALHQRLAEASLTPSVLRFRRLNNPTPRFLFNFHSRAIEMAYLGSQ